MLSQYAQHLDISTEQVRRLCYPLLSKTPITHFDYERFYDDGRHMAFSTTPDMGACAGGEHLLPTRFEMDMFHQVGLRMTFMSHCLELPPGSELLDADKYKNNIACAAQHNTFHRLYFIDRKDDYYRLLGFGVNKENVSVMNYYLNNLVHLERFGVYFERQLAELIHQIVCEHLLTLPTYLFKPALELEAFGQLKEFLASYLDNFELDQKEVSLAPDLTGREQECLSLLAKGYTMKMAANDLSLSPRTVEQHIRNAKDKLGLHTKKQLLEYWYSMGGGDAGC